MSKIKKIIVIKKNRIEKGIRDLLIGLNPHSKGVIFSLCILIFFENIRDNFIVIVVIEIIKIIGKISHIFFIKFKLYNWKLYILFIL